MVQRDYYGVETKVLNQAVKRNFNRFPKDFMFKFIKEEIEILECKKSTSSWVTKSYKCDFSSKRPRFRLVP
jgi:hypothetical protein